MDMFPVIRSFQDNMSNRVSSLIQQQDGCLQVIAQRASQSRKSPTRATGTYPVAQRAAMPSPTDQASNLRAHREAQPEQVRAERDNHFAQEEEVLAHTASTQQ